MKVGIVVPFSWSYIGGRQRACRGAGGGARAARLRDAADHGRRPARHVLAAAAPGCGTTRPAPVARDVDRDDGDGAREQLAHAHRAQPARRDPPRPPAPAREVRPAPRPRADDAGAVRRRARARSLPGRRHLARDRRARLDESRHADVGHADEADRLPDRRLGGRAGLRGALPARGRSRSSRTASRSRRTPTRPTARTSSSTSAATTRARGSRCCSAPGPRSGGGRARRCA